MDRPDFPKALRDADTRLREHPSAPGARRRVRERLLRAESRRTAPWRSLILGAFATAAVAVALLVVLRPASEAPPVPASEPTFAGLAVLERSTALALRLEDGSLRVDSGTGVLADTGLGFAMRLHSGSALKRTIDGVRVRHGRVELAVLPQPRHQPLRVRVSKGVIEVLGTTFTVEERGDSGSVTLHTGRIRFVAEDGETRALRPGERLDWPLPPRTLAPRPQGPEAPAPSAPAPAEPDDDGDDGDAPSAPSPAAPARDEAPKAAAPAESDDPALMARKLLPYFGADRAIAALEELEKSPAEGYAP